MLVTQQPQIKRSLGFTLIEVMAVLVIMGLIVSMVSLNFSSASNKEKLHTEAKRFAAVFNMAADFALLNNVELGLEIIEDNEYRFLFLDDNDQWQIVSGDKALEPYQLPEEYKLELNLDDFPWQQEESLFAEDAFETEEFTLDEEEQKPPFPQVFILSSGDITPFILHFDFLPEFSDEMPARFNAAGEYSAPLNVYEDGYEAG